MGRSPVWPEIPALPGPSALLCAVLPTACASPVTGSSSFGDPQIQRQMLKKEGVTFDDQDRVRLDRHRYIPEPGGMPDGNPSL